MLQKQPYHELIAWKEAHAFTLAIYQVTKAFPTDEKNGITSQLRRAAVSLELNLVEGHAKRSVNDFIRFLGIARGSAKECAVILEIARDLEYLDQEGYNAIESQRSKADFLVGQLMRSMIADRESSSMPS